MPHYDSTWDAITRIVADDGLKGLYAGMNGSLLGVASTNFAYFYWYTVARMLYIKSAKSTSPPPSMAVELAPRSSRRRPRPAIYHSRGRRHDPATDGQGR